MRPTVVSEQSYLDSWSNNQKNHNSIRTWYDASNCIFDKFWYKIEVFIKWMNIRRDIDVSHYISTSTLVVKLMIKDWWIDSKAIWYVINYKDGFVIIKDMPIVEHRIYKVNNFYCDMFRQGDFKF